MEFWTTRSLYVRATHDALPELECKAIRRAHAEEILYHLAHVVMSVTIAFFVGMKEGVIGVPSGLTLWQIISSGGAVWTLSPLEIEALVKGLLLEPNKFLHYTLAVLGIAGVLGGLRGVINATQENLPALQHHARGVWNPRAEAIRYYLQQPKKWHHQIYLTTIKPFDWTEQMIGRVFPSVPKWRVSILPI